MTFLIELSRCIGAVALAAGLAGCGNNAEPLSASVAAPSQARGVQRNDCRSANALTTQKGCRPGGYVVGRQ